MEKILYFGSADPSSTSRHRAEALRRRGYTLQIRDPFATEARILQGPFMNALHYRSGYRFVQKRMAGWLKTILAEVEPFDIVWVDSGELFGPSALKLLKDTGARLVLFNVDDPTGKRDGRRFDSLKKSLPYYDLVGVVRKETEKEAYELGAKDVIRVWRAYDEVAHRPFESLEDIPSKFRSEVAFIGTWMRHEKRDEFIMTLIQQGIPVSIWGGRWPKSPHWNFLKPYYRGASLKGRDYVAAIQGSKICLGLLSKGNRDLHTTRSLEVPYAGGLLCAEETDEHNSLYIAWEEAVFWTDPQSCALACRTLLDDEELRTRIVLNGMKKVRELKVGNEDIGEQVMARLRAKI